MINFITKYLCLCFMCISILSYFSISSNALSSSDVAVNSSDTVATSEEFILWLNSHQEGSVKLTSDIKLDDFIYTHLSKKPINIDTGEFSITITGEVQVETFGGITFTGTSGEDAVLRVTHGGLLYLIDHPDNLDLGIIVDTLAENSIYQEEGAGLVIKGNTLAKNVHYAKTPFIAYWAEQEDTVLASKTQTADDVLPDTLNANVILDGSSSLKDVNVLWNLEEHSQSQLERLRFKAVASVTGYGYNSTPIYTVAYNDYPITFKNISVRNYPKGLIEFRCQFANANLEKNNLITAEYSFDGEVWQVYQDKISGTSTNFAYMFNAGSDLHEGDVIWDTDKNPNIYISLYYNDGNRNCYSNTIAFSCDNLGEEKDYGGIRGGGQVIIPPITPTPNPKPTPTPVPSLPQTNQPLVPETKPISKNKQAKTKSISVKPSPTPVTISPENSPISEVTAPKNNDSNPIEKQTASVYKNGNTGIVAVIICVLLSIGIATLYFKKTMSKK